MFGLGCLCLLVLVFACSWVVYSCRLWVAGCEVVWCLLLVCDWLVCVALEVVAPDLVWVVGGDFVFRFTGGYDVCGFSWLWVDCSGDFVVLILLFGVCISMILMLVLFFWFRFVISC